MPHIRWSIRRDLPTMLRIEQASFPIPWTEDDFLNVLRERNVVGMVAEEGNGSEAVVGYMIYELLPDSIFLTVLAVDPAHRRQGVGAMLLRKLASKLTGHKRTQIHVVVRESNLQAHLFFRAMGYRATNVLRGYYNGDGDTGEDAYGFSYSPPWLASGSETALEIGGER